jgi:hypothetical protein
MLTKNSAAVEIRTKKKTMDDCMNLSTVKKSISQKMTGSKVSSSGPKDKAKDQPPLDYNDNEPVDKLTTSLSFQETVDCQLRIL